MRNWDAHVFDNIPFADTYIFDVHAHTDHYAPFQLGSPMADDLALTANRLGINGLCTSSLSAIRSDWKLGNTETQKACQAYPGLIYGYAVPNPFAEDCELSQYFAQDRGFRGIKVHGSMQGNLPLNDHRFEPAYELAERLTLPVLFHTWTASEVAAAADVAKRHPGVPIILGHAGMTVREQAAEAAGRCENIYVDTAISCTVDGSVEWLVNNVGTDRVLYGSDMAFFDCIQTLGKIALSGLSDWEKEKVLGLNAKDLFRV